MKQVVLNIIIEEIQLWISGFYDCSLGFEYLLRIDKTIFLALNF
jgi:hypothetical protein